MAPGTTYNGSWYNIRILPYRKLDDKIDGVVITYVNITNFKVLEEDLRKRIVVLEEQIADKVVLDGIQQSYGEIAASKYPKG